MFQVFIAEKTRIGKAAFPNTSPEGKCANSSNSFPFYPSAKSPRLLSFKIPFFIVFSIILLFIAACGGEGSSEEIDAEIVIETWRDLQAIKDNPSGLHELVSDITLPDPGTDGMPENGFIPIGSPDNPYTGTFKGNGHVIRNLYINNNDEYTGLFGYIGSEGSVTNLGVETGTKGVTTGRYKMFGGVFAGYNKGTIVGYAKGKITCGGNFCGLFVGYNLGNAIGYAEGTLIGADQERGFIGLLAGESGSNGTNNGKLIGYAKGSITGVSALVGGLLGSGVNFKVQGYARVSITRTKGTDNDFGFLIGRYTSNSSVSRNVPLGYHSVTESSVNVSNRDDYVVDGEPIMMGASITKNDFSKLTFGDEIGQWTWVGDNKWPAINIGSVKPPAKQPIDDDSLTPFSARSPVLTEFKNKLWVVGKYNHRQPDVWSSDDGKTWKKEADSIPIKGDMSRAFAFKNKLWAVTKSALWSSPDGKTWEAVEQGKNSPLYYVEGTEGRLFFATNVFVDPKDNVEKIWILGGYIGNDRNDVWASVDGKEWEEKIGNDDDGNSPTQFTPISRPPAFILNNRLWIITYTDLINYRTYTSWSSSDGITWRVEGSENILPNTSPARKSNNVVIFKDTVFLITENGKLFKSRDGKNWEDASDLLPSGVSSINEGSLIAFKGKLLFFDTKQRIWELMSE